MKRSDLRLGETYAARIVHPAQGTTAPRVEVRKRLELIDVREDGTCVMAEDRLGYDLPPGHADRKVVKRTVLHKVKVSDVLATWEDWQAGEKVRTRTGGLALAPADDQQELAAA